MSGIPWNSQDFWECLSALTFSLAKCRRHTKAKGTDRLVAMAGGSLWKNGIRALGIPEQPGMQRSRDWEKRSSSLGSAFLLPGKGLPWEHPGGFSLSHFHPHPNTHLGSSLSHYHEGFSLFHSCPSTQRDFPIPIPIPTCGADPW